MNDADVITLAGFASDAEGARHFFGTRRAGSLPPGEHGNDDVTSAERHLTAGGSPLQELLAGCRVASVKQVHGTDALVLDGPDPPKGVFERGWDALVTNQPRLCLTIKTADCVPVLLHDPVQGVVAAIHAGWRGAVGGILPKTLSLMRRRFGSVPGNVRMGIGPAAGVCCYEVDAPVLRRLRSEFPEWRAVVREGSEERANLHLHDLVCRQAAAFGVDPAAIRTADLCTICQPDLFYSYRREGRVRGTMISGIVMTARVWIGDRAES